MEEGELKIGNVGEEWTTVANHLSLSQLDHLERVHIQCVESTDFVLGRQTNFNGPVTIINCQDVLKRAAHVQEEEVVIREKVLSQSAIHHMATNSQQNGINSPHSTTSTTRFFRIKTPFVLTGIFVAAIIAAPTFLTISSIKDEPETSKCTPVTDDICLYSQFHWGGRPMPPRVVPLPLPVHYLAISSTTDEDDYCYDYEECLRVVERMQLKQAVPECNFLLGNEGNVYEDRGWEVATAPEGPLTQRLLVCFMGDHITNWPTYPSVEAFHALAKFGVERKYVAEDYVVVGWELSELLHKVISKWPRFCNESEAAGCQGLGSELSVIGVGPSSEEREEREGGVQLQSWITAIGK